MAKTLQMPRTRAPEPRRLLVVAQEAKLRRWVATSLERGGFQPVAVASAREAESQFAGKFELVLVELVMADVDAVDFVARAARRMPQVPIVALCARGDDERVVAAIKAGARGCLYADDIGERLLDAVREALAGSRPMSSGMAEMLFEQLRPSRPPSQQGAAVRPFTPRERAVLEQLARGLEYEDIGSILGISVNTVRTFVRAIYEKLNVNSRTEAVRDGIKLGLIKRTPYPGHKPRP
jgi:DNA-binding NarL/FixJ family response regulator